MTKKDFELIAAVLYVHGADQKLVTLFADALAANNPRFDRNVFVAAATSQPKKKVA